MKKFSKLLALGMALSMAFGVTAFAADSPTVENNSKVEVAGVEGVGEDQKLVVEDATAAQVASAQTAKVSLAAAIAASVTVPEGSKAVVKEVVATFDVSLKNMAGATVNPDGGVTVTFNFAGFDAAKHYAVLHFENGAWTVITATVTPDGVKATFNSFSPVAIVEVGEEVVSNNNSSSDDPATSPATGEALPVAGIMALICLAGAAVCASKVRYNKQ